MTGDQLARYRKDKKRTQVQVARALRVSQTYLSLLESGERRLTESLQKKAARFFDLPPTEVPTRLTYGEVRPVSDDQLASDLADLGYPGFSHLKKKRSRKRNPADVLLSALNAPQREARAVEALPWLLLAFPDVKWNEVTRVAKMNDLQNRLGFLVNVAGEMAKKMNKSSLADLLHAREIDLERSMLAREDTLCNENMTNTERRWLATNRPPNARRWNLLADLSPVDLNHYE
ncbi:MAG: helix-turn-helix transcriptional regulator [Pyrinomonadaceae bacterium]